MKGTIQWTLVLLCILEITKAYYLKNEVIEPLLNYNGMIRSYCPASAHEQPASRQDTSLRLRQLRSEMRRVASIQGPPLDGYIITSDDAHQTANLVYHGRDDLLESDSLDPHDMRREFITGFYGSAGEAVVTTDKAVLWTDGRYHIQADHQLDCNWILMKSGRGEVPSITEWLQHEFHDRNHVRIGADPTLVPAIDWETWENELANSTVRLVPIRNNLVDLIWQVGRPDYNPYQAYPLPDKYSGRAWEDKIQSIRIEMELSGVDALVLTALDEIAWLFNIRGYDLPNTPVLRAYAVVTHESIHLYTPRKKILRSVEEHLKVDFCSHTNCVKWHNYTSIWYDLRTMSQVWKLVWLPTRCGYSPGASMEIFNSIPPEKRLPQPSPVLSLRAQKNKVEAEGMRRSHLRDAVAMCSFLAYLEGQYELNSDSWDEMQVARSVNEFRYEQTDQKGISFPTIAGYGPHAAIPHYEPNNLTNIKIGKTSTLVVDSGGQYLDGTTDVTRTLHFGTPTKDQKKAYTRVLIASIQLASLIFPSTLKSNELDVVARAPLWNIGYDYLHGTGHGIGHFLSVHESPISISYTQATASDKVCGPVELKPGFFLSNEPGYYKEGDFGVRLENILETVEADKSDSGKTFLKFRDVTLVPYEPKLIDFEMLNPAHIRWLNNYNRRIRDEVGPELKKKLKEDTVKWMLTKTALVDEERPCDSHSPPSTFKQFHTLVYLTFIYHILLSLSHIWS